MGFEVVVSGKYTGGYKFFLKDLHEVEEIFGIAVAYVVDREWRNGEAVLPILSFGRLIHYADNALNYIVDISKISLAVAVVEDFDGLAFEQFVGEAEVCHVGATCGTVYGEEPQAGRGNVI